MTSPSKSLKDLPKDIYGLFEKGKEFTDEELEEIGKRFSSLFKRRLSEKEINSRNDALRMSNLGTQCDRKLWYTCNQPEDAEPLDPKTRFKFLYGDMIEETALILAKAAGHEVKGEQTRLEIDGVIGHRDAIIDGVVVDVKSASSRGMDKFKKHDLENNDPFGYLDQLGAYLHASSNDPDVKVKGEAAFIAVDKEMGNIVVDTYKKRDTDYDELVKEKKDMVTHADPPRRRYFPQADGASGNLKLGTECSYCPFKKTCWPGLRTFIYSTGPRYLTEVKRVPDVPEVT